MTIVIDDPWRMLGCTVLAGAVLYLTAAIVVMTAWGGGWPRIVVGWAVGLAGITCAVLLVMAGGGWL